MKIGILTFHNCINYGSYWQTFCLAEKLKQGGHQVFVLNHYSGRVNFAEWKCALQPVLPTPVPKSDQPLYRKKIEKFFSAIKSLPLSNPFPLEYPSEMEDFNLVIAGSDEVWNLSHPWYGYYPVFYGEGIRAKRLISYAASFGNYDVTWKPDRRWLDKLRRFNRISVRDENSRVIIQNSLGYSPDEVLDPCLLFPEFPGKNEKIINKSYVSVYGHNFSPGFIRNIKQWAGKRKIPLISIGYRNDWADEQWLTAGPHEFASFMSQSEAVITNFFHGCIFALVFSKPFVCETSEYRNHKILDLMRKTGGEEHLAGENSTLSFFIEHLENPPDERIPKKIASLRKFSDDWLTRAIENNVYSRKYV